MSKNGKLTGYVLGRFSDNGLITRARQTDEHIASLKAERADLLAQAQRDAAVIAEMKAGLLHLAYIMSETAGIAGWHLNGELLTWEEFAVCNDIMRTAIAAAESRAEAKPEPESKAKPQIDIMAELGKSLAARDEAERLKREAAGPEVRGC